MHTRAYLLAALLMSPAWAQEPVGFDLKSDAIQKLVRDTAATQYAQVQVPDKAPEAKPAEFKYVPPEKPEAPAPEPPRKPPAESPRSNGFLSSMLFDLLVDELLDVEDDGVTSRNEILRCRVQKDLKTSPPGPDHCPSAD